MRNLALITAAVLAAAAPTSADEPIPAKAKKLADHGRDMHKRGEYDRAIVAFKEAYVIAPSPGLLFNLAQSYRLQGNCDDAVLMYRRYLATGPSVEARGVAETHLATVERCVQKRALNIPLDDSMAYLKVPPPPGPEKVIVDDKRDIERPTHLKKDLGIGLAIGGGVALVTAAYFGVRSWQAERDVERAYEEGAKWPEIKEIDERGENAARAAKIFGIGGGIAVIGGVTLFMLGRRDERASQLAVTPVANGSGAQVSYAWPF
ncbi:MAG TPA: tetratricopeptide repeat protein [Kofleriaceae bacterium]|nr:tetratricopeptide repeat protein [Kofleriaceae bacterium]